MNNIKILFNSAVIALIVISITNVIITIFKREIFYLWFFVMIRIKFCYINLSPFLLTCSKHYKCYIDRVNYWCTRIRNQHLWMFRLSESVLQNQHLHWYQQVHAEHPGHPWFLHRIYGWNLYKVECVWYYCRGCNRTHLLH